MEEVLDIKEKDYLLSQLTSEQKEFIVNRNKNSKKTIFANVLAKDKGIILPKDTNVNQIEYLLDEWILEDYIENETVNPATPCECGRPLKYQYIVKHKSTNEIRRFGINHFKEHTGLSLKVVQEIIKGFYSIDNELNEILLKYKQGWILSNENIQIPKKVVIPKEIQAQLSLNIPLLDSQIKKLRILINAYRENTSLDHKPQPLKNITQESELLYKNSTDEQYTFELFQEEIINENSIEIPNYFESQHVYAIDKYLSDGVQSARIISELLIKDFNFKNTRYSTMKPHIYILVCEYLDQLVYNEKLELLDGSKKEDRTYKQF